MKAKWNSKIHLYNLLFAFCAVLSAFGFKLVKSANTSPKIFVVLKIFIWVK